MKRNILNFLKVLKINKTLRINRNVFKVKNFDLKVKPLISLHIFNKCRTINDFCLQ